MAAVVRATAGDARISGLGLSASQIRRARKRKGCERVSFLVGDAASTSFTDARFDKVLITHALHDMSRSGRLAVMREVRRVLRTGGEIVVLELGQPTGLLLQAFTGLWFFHWPPFSFETRTRRDMLRRGVATELAESGLQSLTATPAAGEASETVCGRKWGPLPPIAPRPTRGRLGGLAGLASWPWAMRSGTARRPHDHRRSRRRSPRGHSRTGAA